LYCLSFVAAAQEGSIRKYFEIVNDIAVVRSDIRGKILEDSFFIPPNNTEIALINHKNADSVVVKFIHWSSNTKIINRYRDSIIFKTGERAVSGKEYYLVKKTDLDSNCASIYGRGVRAVNFTIGFVTMPVKLRIGKNFEFQSTISLGTTVGIKMRLSRHYPNYLNFLIGASTSTVSLDSFSTRGKISGQPITNIFVFSPSVGVVVEFAKSQIGLFSGYDLLGKSNNVQYNWIYQRKPWISLGFGFSIFSLEESKK
jgi:hypothetical protein